MAKLNLARVFVGGLLAGVVINIGEFILNMGLLGKVMEDALKELKRPPMGNEAIAFYVLMGFGLGIVMIWVYAAIRTRFGPGPTTAICAGLTVWALSYLYPNAGMLPLHLFPRRLLFYSTVWGFFELPIAAIISGVRPKTVCASTFAPASASRRMMSAWFSCAACAMAVQPPESRAFASAPRASRNRTLSSRP